MLESVYDGVTNTLKFEFTGRMDALRTREAEGVLTKTLATAVEEHRDVRVVFDMSGVEYIASSFIRLCLSTAKELAEGNFSIANTNPLIKKTFKIAGLESVLNVS